MWRNQAMILAAVMLVGAGGCLTTPRNKNPQPGLAANPFAPPPQPAAVFPGGQPAPAFPGANAAPVFPGNGSVNPGLPPTNSRVVPPPVPMETPPAPVFPTTPTPGPTSKLEPSPWQIAAAPPQVAVFLLPPEPILEKGAPTETTRLYPLSTPADATRIAKVSAGLPVGIPQFAVVKDNQVSAGLRPSLDEGLDWLQVNGYKTVL